jgi:hypothetical protein
MRLASTVVGTCAAVALVATAFDADARGGRGGGRGKAGQHSHHHTRHGASHGHSHIGFFVASSFGVWPRAYYWPDYHAAAVPVVEYWYYCQAYAAYYPYVQDCPGGWQPVLPSLPPTED